MIDDVIRKLELPQEPIPSGLEAQIQKSMSRRRFLELATKTTAGLGLASAGLNFLAPSVAEASSRSQGFDLVTWLVLMDFKIPTKYVLFHYTSQSTNALTPVIGCMDGKSLVFSYMNTGTNREYIGAVTEHIPTDRKGERDYVFSNVNAGTNSRLPLNVTRNPKNEKGEISYVFSYDYGGTNQTEFGVVIHKDNYWVFSHVNGGTNTVTPGVILDTGDDFVFSNINDGTNSCAFGIIHKKIKGYQYFSYINQGTNSNLPVIIEFTDNFNRVKEMIDWYNIPFYDSVSTLQDAQNIPIWTKPEKLAESKNIPLWTNPKILAEKKGIKHYTSSKQIFR